MLSIQPTMGRNFDSDEERAGHDRVLILSSDCWRNRFNSDPKILGRTLTFSDGKRVVVGVLPPGFRFEDREFFAPLIPGTAAIDHSESSMNFHAYDRT